MTTQPRWRTLQSLLLNGTPSVTVWRKLPQKLSDSATRSIKTGLMITSDLLRQKNEAHTAKTQTKPVFKTNGKNFAHVPWKNSGIWRMTGGPRKHVRSQVLLIQTKYKNSKKPKNSPWTNAPHNSPCEVQRWKHRDQGPPGYSFAMGRTPEWTTQHNCLNPTDPTLLEQIHQFPLIHDLDAIPSFHKVTEAVKGLKYSSRYRSLW